jgi:hypothetical protein
VGLEATCQTVEAEQANALLKYPGRGDGPALLLYAPIDTHTIGAAADDVPWVGPTLREDMVPRASVHGDYVVGLGANNPKGHAACVLAAVEAACRVGAPVRGAVLAGFGSGGMPISPRPGATRREAGHGSGCAFMLEHGFRGDFAVIAKTGWAVAWEEVGLAWFRVRVHGAELRGHPALRPLREPDRARGHVIGKLERWFAVHEGQHVGLVAPGKHRRHRGRLDPQADLRARRLRPVLDLRLSPRTSVPDASASSRTPSRRSGSGIRDPAHVGDLSPCRDPHRSGKLDRPVVHARLGGRRGRPHAPRANQSGATDANILRGHGLPTARVGMARVPDDAPMPDDFSKGMNVVSLREMERLTRCLVYVIVDTCLSSWREDGLDPT